MDTGELRERVTTIFQKYRYGLLVLLAGIFLMLLPGPSTAEEPEPIVQESVQEETFDARLSWMLSQMEGAGEVQVFLSQATGSETRYQTDESHSSGDIHRDTVLVTGTDRAQTGLVQRIDPPVYRGAIVLCQGADNAAVRLAITQAVANATGLGTNQISVLKMK